MQRLPAGTWPSPITAASLVGGADEVGEVVVDGPRVWWAESRPDEGGRTAVLCWADGSVAEVTSPEANVRTRVHEYGGGAWWAADGVLYYVDDADQRLRRQRVGEPPVLLTPEPLQPKSLRYADGRVTPDGNWYVCVRERFIDHVVLNELVAIATDGSMNVHRIAGGADFYASPRVSPDGSQLVWVQWMHPSMPWDSTELWIADLFDGTTSNPRLLVGNGDEALQQPEWGDDGELYVVSDRSNWWNIYRVGSDVGIEVLEHHAGGDYEVVEPMWNFGGSGYAFGASGSEVHVVREPAADRLSIGAALPYTAISSLRMQGDDVVFLGASFQREGEVVRLSADASGAPSPEVLRSARTLPFATDFLPDPEFITFPTGIGAVAHALYYAPAHPSVALPDDELPPVLVFIHGGPTAAAGRAFAARRSHRFWTSRGIAVVDVDYRGSTRYGRAYRNLLREQWCVVDVEDAAAAVDFLVARGDVDGSRALIRGGSAGGTTTLLALSHTNRFAAGANYFGVTDLAALLSDEHKFESRYTVQLIGDWPEQADRYAERSPINHVDRLTTPLIVLQGLDDTVVPPAHSDRIVDAVRARGLPVAYLRFEGEGHGFRRAENMIRAMEAELWFYGQVLGFEPADDIEPVPLAGD
ncbi:MAG TPA: prolyl oligopeptidase family serine peptidase [Ilumatobacter sp.]|nr:prolyl oligopeptidase family serine peptidase [Ilumatobacter sp.]